MADAPWIKWFTSDFLNGVSDLEADEIGIYAVVLNLQADKGAPIDDDARWLARRCGTSTRRFNQVRARLISLGKLEARAGMLANARMMAEVQKRDGKSRQARDAALARWHGDREPELPLDGQDPSLAGARARTDDEKTKIKSGKTPEQIDLNEPVKSRKPQSSAVSADADASPPVRARQKLEDSDSTRPSHSAGPVRARTREAGGEDPPDRLNDADLKAKVDAVCEAAGYRPVSPGQIDRAYRIVQEWIKDRLDFDLVVIPTIRAVVSESRDPTRTLGRFSARVRHEQARLKAQPNGRAYAPPSSPVLEVEGEEPVMKLIRTELLERLGPGPYCTVANTARLERVEDAGGNRTPLRVIQNGPTRLNDGTASATLRAIARRHGFTEVW